MSSEETSNELKAKRLCYRCVRESYLRAEIERQGVEGHCSFCQRTGKSYTIGEMAERIEQAFAQHYTRTPDQPNSWQQSLLSDRESDYDWERDGEPVVWAIANAADMPEEAAQDIQTILNEEYDDFDSAKVGEETEFCSESYYEENGASDLAWQEEWNGFERSLKAEARFFSRTAATYLGSLFNHIESMSTFDGRPLVIPAGPGTSLSTIYRARSFQSDNLLAAALCHPDQQLGPPPESLATAGRMNAHGITVFYGTNDPRVAIAEVRPPVGSQVAVARFEIIRPLRLLDLTALSAVGEDGSVFDPNFADRIERAMFLRSLSQRITQPVMPDDEASDYLPTQAIADFLATESESSIDGILFPSVQTAGEERNIVLFHKAARVEAIDVPEGTEIEVTPQMSGEGSDTVYLVAEQVPPSPVPDEMPAEDRRSPNFDAIARFPWPSPDYDSREPALRIDIDSIRVHVVRRVEFDTTEYNVVRHRQEKREPPF